MSTHEQISQSIIERGYRDVGTHQCSTPGCDNLLDHDAIRLGFPGCMCECRMCLERDLKGDTIEDRMHARQRPAYPTTGRISADDPSIYGSAVLGHEGELWTSFNSPQISYQCPEPYRRGVGQGFGSTEDGQEDDL